MEKIGKKNIIKQSRIRKKMKVEINIGRMIEIGMASFQGGKRVALRLN